MIRKAETKDIPYIQTICGIEGLKPAVGCEYDTEWLEELITSRRTVFFVYVIDDIPVGFITGEKLISNGLLIWMCGVSEKYNNKGFGVKLLQHLEDYCSINDITWIITYGHQGVETMDKKMKKLGFKSNNSIYKEYVKELNYIH